MTARLAAMRPSSLLRAANPLGWWRRWRSRPPAPPPVLPEYTGRNFFQRHRKKLLTLLFVLTWFYVVYFQLFGRFIMVQYLAPLIVIAVLIIWALPERRSAPIRTLEWLFFAFLIALIIWPDYLAIALPGLPWVTAVRLIGFPMAIVLLFALSVSTPFRTEIKAILRSSNPIWPMFVGFIILCLLTLAVTKDITLSFNKVVVALLNWLSVFVVACFVFTRPGRARLFAYIMWAAMLFWCAMGVWEARLSHVPWSGHIPSFLTIEDETVQRILAGAARAATGIYRVQGKFTTSLGLAEFLALGTPFVIHFLMTSRSLLIRIAAAVTLPIVFYTIIKTDSRLGVVGFFMSMLVYLLAWGAYRWRHVANSLFGPAITLTYPALFSSFIAATFFVGRLRAMVWGTGAQQFSTESRKVQVAMAIPKIFSEPWGHGLGRAADVLGFTNLAGILTIDSYYLAVALDVGVLGFVLYFGMLIAGIYKSGRQFLITTSVEAGLLAPVAISLVNFFIIKSVLSQQENHPLVFMILAMAVALIWRDQQRMAREAASSAVALRGA